MVEAIPGELITRNGPPRILVVEDESIVAMDLVAQLGDMGYEVCGNVDNGRDAIGRADAQHPDLVLMDIVIRGDMDGIETAASISRGLHIPVVYLTAYSDERTVERAARTGPYGYLTKPFQTAELRAGIEVALYKSRLERQLRNSEQWFASTLRCVADSVVATNAHGHIRFMNPAAEALLGCRVDDVIGCDVGEVIRLEDARSHASLESPVRHALENNTTADIEFGSLLVARNGERLPVDDSAAPIRDDEGKVLGAVMVFRDVRERLEAENRLRQSEQRFRSAFDFAPVGMALVSLDNHFLQVNSAICKLLGVSESELVGADQGMFCHHDSLKNERACLYELLSGNSASEQFEKRYRSCNGKDIWTLVSVSLLRQNDEPLCFLFQVHDVSERKEAEYRLTRLAHFDSLTGLANRAYLSDEIEREIVAARRHQRGLAVVFIDLDHFKQVNDSLGHEAGDELLQTVAARLRASVRETDIVGRLGGDEFVILLPEIRNAEDVLPVTNKVRAECGKPAHISGQEMRIGISLGVSLFPDDAQDSRTLLRYADSALYHAKAEGRNHLQFYRPELTARMEERMRLGGNLRSALERGEFELHFQPIMSLANHRPRAAEALIRWNHPELGLLAPNTFIPLAEEIGLSAAIGEWVIGEACHQAASWGAAGGMPLHVAVNVSASQFKAGNLVQVVRKALAAAGFPAQRLCLEITEQLLLGDSTKNLDILAQLKALGVGIAIDDFGTGYSSLSYISHFAPTELKIDRSLIADDDGEHVALVTAAIAMARSLKLQVVTEGVETKAQEAFLQSQGCEMAQGFLYAEPCAGPEFLDWLRRTGNGQQAASR